MTSAGAGKSVVAVCRCPDYEPVRVREAVERCLGLLGGAEKFIGPGRKILIKPNLIVPAPTEQPAQTHREVIIAMAQAVKDRGATPMVGDSPAWGNIRGCLAAMGAIEPLEKMGVEIVQLNRPVVCHIDGARVRLSRYALEADAIINLPKFKAHQQLVATFAVKNMFGCVVGKEKPYWHFARGKSERRFCRLLIEIYRRLSPALNLIDGVVAMQGQGPIRGQPYPLGFLIAGTEPIACEVVCGRLIGIEAGELPMVRTAEKMGFGQSQWSEIEIAGDDFGPFVRKDFQRAQLTPLRFSLPRIFKSIAKQILLLAGNVVRKVNSE
jgi:uncharacterized protein (DUF362 family)